MSQAVLPYVRWQMKGKIIQISSRSGFRPLPSMSVYTTSKSALEGISETMLATFKSWNVDVSLIEPDPVKTDLDSYRLIVRIYQKIKVPILPYLRRPIF